MKSFFKKLLFFTLILLLYYLPGIIWMTDKKYYLSLNLPPYAPSPLIFGLTWGVLYLIFAVFITYIVSNNKMNKEIKSSFIINYIVSFFFNFVFFKMNNLFLTFAITILSCASGILIFISLLKENRVYASVVTPYVLWTIFASILMTNIYLIN